MPLFFSPGSTSPETTTDSSLPVVDDAPRACCGGLGRLFLGVWAVVTILAIGAAAYFAGRASQVSEHERQAFAAAAQFPPIGATAAVSSEKFSVATGAVSEEAEGFFVLDHNSGLLQCSVIYPRIGKVMAQFTVNVSEALATGGKGGSYIMATGLVDFPRASNNPIGSSVVYVLDTATGNYAAYMIPFNRVALNAGQAQQSTMRLLFQGTANPVIDRDALR